MKDMFEQEKAQHGQFLKMENPQKDNAGKEASENDGPEKEYP